VQITGIDLRLFEFDYDVTWYVFFLNADETIYGRYGGRDATGDQSRISTKGLRHAMGRALEAHQTPPPPAKRADPPLRPEDIPAAKRHKGCIHCHNINEFRRTDAKAAGTWDRSSVWAYPPPDNVGITVDLDAGDRVKAIRAGSPAEKAGIKPGDVLRRLNGLPVASFGDASYALHKAPAKGSIPVVWTQGGKERTGTLELPDGWRKTNITWRPSLLDILPSAPFAGEELTADDRRRLGLTAARAAFRVGDNIHPTLVTAGFRAGDVVIGFNGVALDGGTGDLLGYLRRNFLVGDAVAVDVLRGGRRTEVKLMLSN
jgi:hypothetical protein